MRKLLAIGLLLSVGSVSAATITIDDFGPTSSGGAEGLEVNTVAFTFGPDPHLNSPQPHYQSGTELQWCPDCTMSMALASGDAFDLSSVALAPWDTATVTITGFLQAGGTVSQTVNLSSPFIFLTVNFDSAWADLDYVEFSSDNGLSPTAIDNIAITTTAVPVPAAVWLFGSALAGLGWMRRKATV
jgi:hypothetical protein